VKSRTENIAPKVVEILEMMQDVAQPRKSFTINYLVDVYRGSRQSKIIQNGHDKIKSFSKAANLKRTEVESKR
jgi:superfamily II DNA helicase RecQ